MNTRTTSPSTTAVLDSPDRSPVSVSPAPVPDAPAPARGPARRPHTHRDAGGWTPACAIHRLLPGRGVAVLLRGGRQAALFLLTDGSLHAVGNIDPSAGAAVMSRGIVGDRGGEATVASPLLKEVYSLTDGRCLNVPGLTLPVHPVRVEDGVIHVGPAGAGSPGI